MKELPRQLQMLHYRYRLSSLYQLDQAPMVNVRDLAGVQNALKLLVQPEPRLFQCKDGEAKREWLALYEVGV